MNDYQLAAELEKRINKQRQRHADGELLLGDNYRRVLDELSYLLENFRRFN